MEENRKKRLEEIIGGKINPKEVPQPPQDFLLSTIERLCELEAIGQASHQLGISLFELEERYILLIKDLFEQKYSPEISEIVFWWVFESITPDGKILPLEDENGKNHIFKTPKQLVKYLKKHYNA